MSDHSGKHKRKFLIPKTEEEKNKDAERAKRKSMRKPLPPRNTESAASSSSKMDKVHPHMGNKSVSQILSTVVPSTGSSRPKPKYTSREDRSKKKSEEAGKTKKGGYRYSELGMKGLTIALDDDIAPKKKRMTRKKGKMIKKSKKNKKNKKIKKAKKSKMTRKAKK